MFARCILIIAAALAFAGPGFAQVPYQFRWQKGQTLTYKIQHVTSVVETLEKNINTVSSHLDLINRWHVTEVDAKGVATLTLTLVSFATNKSWPAATRCSSIRKTWRRARRNCVSRCRNTSGKS